MEDSRRSSTTLLRSSAECNAAQELALDDDTCKQILRETGCLSTGRVGAVDLTKIPDGLNAEEMERFLRENAAKICAFPPGAHRLKQLPISTNNAVVRRTDYFRLRRDPGAIRTGTRIRQSGLSAL